MKHRIGALCAVAFLAAIAFFTFSEVRNAFATQDIGATKSTAWSQTVGGFYKTTPGTIADGETDALRLTSAGLLRVSLDGNTVGTTDQETVGNVAHDAADSGNPVKFGGKGSAAVASDVTEGDRVNGSFTLAGRFRVEDQAGYTAHDAADAGNPLKVGAKAISLTNTAEVSATGDRANTVSDLYGRTRVVTHRDKDTWTANHSPATNVLAAVTKTASAGVKHVVTGFSASIASDGASTPAVMKVQIIEDNSGTPVVHWTEVISTVATSGQGASIYRGGLNIVPNAANKSITLTFSVAGGTNTTQAVSLQGESFAP